ncbi:MAG: hypothetical protein KF901_17430 [Myxococcales bacterium]|nr:hypothetical protein [Myxococcales bacterium]
MVGLDTPGRRLVLVEGLGANRGLAWELPLDAREPRWVALDTGATAPPLLEEPSVASDERGRLFVFEGTASPPTLHVLDLRARGHERWASITLPESARRVGASMAYDAARDRLLLFGGEVEGEILDGLATVTLADPPQWAEVDVGGIRPAPRRDASIAIDTTTQRLYLLGGRDATPLLDAWALELATDRFASLPIALSSAVIGQAMVARGDALLVWHLDGTTGPTRVRLSDFEVSELAGDGPPSSPRPSAFVWGDDALVVTSRGEAISSGVSAWRIAEGGAGELLHGVGVHAPPALERAASGTLSERWYVLLGSSPSNARHLDAWVFDRDRWSPIAWTGTPPAAGADASQAVPSGDRLALFAGGTAYELTAASSTTLSSRRLNDGSIPAFSGATAFEGCDGSTPIGVTGGGAMSDWYTSSQVLVCGTTCAFREGSAPAPEPGRGFSASTRMNVGGADRVVLWGGYANISPLPSSLHTTARPCGASGPTWSSVSVSGATPGGRGGHTLTRVDASRALMFGGSFFAASPREGGRSSELWSLDTSAASARWTRLEPPGTRPSGRIFHVAGWDEARQRLLVFGGRSGLPTHETFGDLWELRVLP